jgi:hypothetical protein
MVVGDIIHEYATISSSIELIAQWLEPFLTSRIPNLHNARSLINFHFFTAKVCSDGWLEYVCELSMLEHLDQWCFAHTWISNHYCFKNMPFVWASCWKSCLRRSLLFHYLLFNEFSYFLFLWLFLSFLFRSNYYFFFILLCWDLLMIQLLLFHLF